MDKNNNVIWKNLSEIGFSKYDISTNGYIRSAKHKKILSIKPNRNGYRYSYLISDSGLSTSKSISLIMLRVFKGIKVDIRSEVVLFKDGNSSNYSIDNLEVYNYRDSDYTYSRPGIEVIATNLETGEKKIFPYAKHAFKFFNCARYTLYRVIDEDDRYLTKDGQEWSITIVSDKEEAIELFKEYDKSLPGEVWYSMEGEPGISSYHYISNLGRIRYKYTVYTNRKLSYEYDKPKLVVSLLSDCRSRSTSKHFAPLVVKYVKGIELVKGKQRIVHIDGDCKNVLPDNLTVEDIVFSTVGRTPVRVKLTDVKTGGVKICESISEAERYLEYSKGSLTASFRRNPDKIYRGYKIERI